MIKFKNNNDKTLFCCLHPVLIMIFSDLYWYAKVNHNVELVVTQTISTPEIDKRLNRVSKSHLEKRAIDIRTKDLDKKVIDDLLYYINNKCAYKDYGYMSKSGVKRLAYYHIGTEEHLHLAIHKKFALK